MWDTGKRMGRRPARGGKGRRVGRWHALGDCPKGNTEEEDLGKGFLSCEGVRPTEGKKKIVHKATPLEKRALERGPAKGKKGARSAADGKRVPTRTSKKTKAR